MVSTKRSRPGGNGKLFNTEIVDARRLRGRARPASNDTVHVCCSSVERIALPGRPYTVLVGMSHDHTVRWLIFATRYRGALVHQCKR